MKKSVLNIVAASIFALSGSAFAQDAVTIATDATFPPFESIDANGNLVGYDIELMEAICAAAALNCDIINAAWDGMFPGLLAGKYDALISSLTVTEERRKTFAFSDIYSHPTFRFVVKAGESFEFTDAGLAGKSIAVQTGTPMDAFVSKTFPSANIQRYDGGSAPYLELSAGRADMHMSYEAQIIASFLKTDSGKGYELAGPSYTGADAPEFGEGVAIALAPDNTELQAKINEGLAKVVADGTLEAIEKKYLTVE
jgi:arginine/ornithine transport system substrate-binding protein